MIADVEGDYGDLSNVEIPTSLPILAVRNIVLFPGVITPILIGREPSMKIVRMAEKSNGCPKLCMNTTPTISGNRSQSKTLYCKSKLVFI